MRQVSQLPVSVWLGNVDCFILMFTTCAMHSSIIPGIGLDGLSLRISSGVICLASIGFLGLPPFLDFTGLPPFDFCTAREMAIPSFQKTGSLDVVVPLSLQLVIVA